MKVTIGKYKNYIGPFQIAEMVFFWCKKYPNEQEQERWDYKLLDKFGDFLAYGFSKEPVRANGRRYWDDERPSSCLNKLCNWIQRNRKRKVEIQIDPWDTWNMDGTLAMIIYPMLKQLKKDKHGGPFVDDEDVPEELKSTSAPPKKCEYDVDDNHFKRWDYVLDEMIWTFGQHVGDEEPEFWIEKPEGMYFEPCEDRPNLSRMGYDKEGKFDEVAYKAYHARKANGFRLFGKYYQGLWD